MSHGLARETRFEPGNEAIHPHAVPAPAGGASDEIDYRRILKNAFETRRGTGSALTYRSLGRLLGLDTANVFRILNGEAHLPARCHSHAIEFLGFSGAEAERFLLLVALARERNPRLRAEVLDRLRSLRESVAHGDERRAGSSALPVRQSAGPGVHQDGPAMLEILGMIEDCARAVRDRIARARDPEILRRDVRALLDARTLLD